MGHYYVLIHIMSYTLRTCNVLYIHYPTHTYKAKYTYKAKLDTAIHNSTGLYKAIQGYTQLYKAIHSYTQL